MIDIEGRVPPGWRKLIAALNRAEGVDVVDAYEDVYTGELVVRAGVVDESLFSLVREAEARAAKTCRECGKPGDLFRRKKRVLCWDHRPPPQKILRNSARCDMCGDHIESTHRHDFKFCSCGNIGVDGGKEYIRRVGMKGPWTDTSIHEGDDDEG